MSGVHGEEGAATSALLVLGAFLGLAGFVYVAVPFGAASDAKAQNRTAADAAALAGAEAVQTKVVGVLASGALPDDWVGLSNGLGAGEAREYAAHNGADLVEYYFDPADGTVHATVEGHPSDGVASRSEAVAEVDLPDCSAATPPEQEPQPSQPPQPPQRPEPPVDDSVECGVLDLDAEWHYDENGVPTVTITPDGLVELGEATDARLVG